MSLAHFICDPQKCLKYKWSTKQLLITILADFIADIYSLMQSLSVNFYVGTRLGKSVTVYYIKINNLTVKQFNNSATVQM